MTDRIILSPPERRELQRMSRSRSARNEDVRRANILLSLASGAYSLREISRAAAMQCEHGAPLAVSVSGAAIGRTF
jgi:hypothetical protein